MMDSPETASQGHEAVIRDLVGLLTGRLAAASVDLERPCLWHVAKENDLLLALGDAVAATRLEAMPPAYQPRYQLLQARRRNTADLMAELLPAFQKAGLPVLTMKSFLPFAYVDSNVDLFAVQSERWQAYIQRLHALGFVRWRSLADWREPRKKIYRRYAAADKERRHPYVHLHQAVSWNGVVYLDLEAVAARQRQLIWQGVAVPAPAAADELLIMAAHAYFENKFISLHELLYFYYLCQEEVDWTAVSAAAARYHWEHAWLYFLERMTAWAARAGLPLPEALSGSAQRSVTLRMPCLLPPMHTFAVSWRKLGMDVGNGRLRELPRQLLSYTVVDGLWMYRKAWRKRKAVQPC